MQHFLSEVASASSLTTQQLSNGQYIA